MILITVGTEKFPFNRLMGWIDTLIKQNLIQSQKEEIVVQYGSCTIIPDGVQKYSLLPSSEFQTLAKKARLIIAHCGEGTIDLLSSVTKPFILVARSGELEEHVDDHQIELAKQLSKQGIPIANSPEDLLNFIESPQFVRVKTTPTEYYASASLLLEENFDTDCVLKDLTKELIDFNAVFA